MKPEPRATAREVRLPVVTSVQSIDPIEHTVTALVSTQDVVRDNAIVLSTAWWGRMEHYLANPVLLWCHPWTYDAPDKAPWVVIGKALSVDVTDEGLVCKFQYAVNENPAAKLVFDLLAGGYIRAYSVGFYPYASVTRLSTDEEKAALPEFARNALEAGECYEVFTDVELWEVSQVWIGSDRRALVQAVDAGQVLPELLTSAGIILERSQPMDEPVSQAPEADVAEPVEESPAVNEQPEAEPVAFAGKKISKANRARIEAAAQRAEESAAELRKLLNEIDEPEEEDEKAQAAPAKADLTLSECFQRWLKLP